MSDNQLLTLYLLFFLSLNVFCELQSEARFDLLLLGKCLYTFPNNASRNFEQMQLIYSFHRSTLKIFFSLFFWIILNRLYCALFWIYIVKLTLKT